MEQRGGDVRQHQHPTAFELDLYAVQMLDREALGLFVQPAHQGSFVLPGTVNLSRGPVVSREPRPQLAQFVAGQRQQFQELAKRQHSIESRQESREDEPSLGITREGQFRIAPRRLHQRPSVGLGADTYRAVALAHIFHPRGGAEGDSDAGAVPAVLQHQFDERQQQIVADQRLSLLVEGGESLAMAPHEQAHIRMESAYHFPHLARPPLVGRPRFLGTRRVHIGVQCGGLTPQPPQHRRHQQTQRAIGVVDHQLRPPPPDRLSVHEAQEVLRVVLHSATEKLQGAHRIQGHAPEILAEEYCFDPPVCPTIQVLACSIEELDQNLAWVTRRYRDVNASGRSRDVRHVPCHRSGHDPQIERVGPHRHQSGDDRSLGQAGDVVRIPACDHLCPGFQVGAERRPQPGGDLRCDVDVRQSGDSTGPEQRPRPFGAPDQAHRHLGATLGGLVRPHPDVGHDDGALIQETPVSHHRAFMDRHLPFGHHVPTDGSALDPAAVSQVGPAPDDGMLDHSPRFHHAMVPHNGERPYLGLSSHTALAADQYRRLQACCGVYHRVLPDPDPFAHLHPRQFHRDQAAQAVLVRGTILFEVAYVRPIPVCDIPAEPLSLGKEGRKQIFAEVKGSPRLYLGQHLRLQDVDAGVHRVREHLAGARFLQEPLDRPLRICYHDAILQRIGHAGKHQRADRAPLPVKLDRRAQVNVCQSISADDQERPLQPIQQPPDTSRGSQGNILDYVVELQLELGPVWQQPAGPARSLRAEVALHLVGPVVQGRERLLHSQAPQEPGNVVHYRTIGHWRHRLGKIAGKRPQPRPFSASHDHRLDHSCHSHPRLASRGDFHRREVPRPDPGPGHSDLPLLKCVIPCTQHVRVDT